MLNETQNILDRLRVADRIHQKEVGTQLVLRSVKFACAAVLLFFVLDVIFHLGADARLVLSLILLAGVLALTWFAWRCAFVDRNCVEHTARFLETRDPALGSRLINFLQLDEQARDEKLAPLTRDLARQAVEGYAADLRSVPVEKIARTGEVRLHSRRALWAFLGFAAVLILCFHITGTEVLRFLDPFGDHPPYSFTTLTIVDPASGISVAYGKGVIVKVTVGGHRPSEVFITSYPPGHPEQAVTIPMFDEGGVGFNQQLDHIQTDLVVYAHTKDHASESKQIHLGVVLTPRLDAAFVHIMPPDYTRLHPGEKPYDFKGVQALEGSTIQFRLQSNRPLRDGTLEVTQGEKPPQTITLKKTADNEVSGSFVATDSGRVRFGVVDTSGLPSQGDHESGLIVTHDLPPEVHITNPEHDSAVAMDFKLQAQIESSDDYGLVEVRFHCGINGTYPPPQVFKYDPSRLDSRETVPFDFATMGLKPGDMISLFAEAIDNAPTPHLSRSQTVHLEVISVEDYNNFLREQSDITNTEAKYAQLNNDLQDLIDRQKALGAEAQKISDQLAQATTPDQKQALQQQLDQLIAQQNELNQKLNKQADRMDNFVRNDPVYDVEKDMQAMLHEEAQNIRASTQANDAANKDVAQRSSPTSGSRQLTPGMLSDYLKASNNQVAQLSQSHDNTNQKVVQPLQDMSKMQALVSDFNMFEALTKKQGELTQQAQAYNRPGPLEREDQLALTDIASTQDNVGQALHALRAKLSDDSKAAHDLFPKASRSGEELADDIGTNLMEPLAQQATDQMLQGNGDQSYQLADRLHTAMERLFAQAQAGNGPSSDELDTYLRLEHLNPGGTFSQMSRSHHFGLGKGFGMAGGSGNGQDGSSGYAMMDGSNVSVLGNENFATDTKANSRQSSPYGRGSADIPAANRGTAENPDTLNGLNPVTRHSSASATETEIEEYNDVVDNYFKTLAAKKDKPAHAKAP